MRAARSHPVAAAVATQLVAVAGWSVHLPGVEHLPAVPGLPALAPACSADQAHTVLGRKGLLYKEPATRLALCAVHRALGLPIGARPQLPLNADTAVVAASNFGNVQTVVEVARTVAVEGGRGVSPMSAPNASSNVIASSVGLWFRFGGPNLMVCSGATAGLDAITVAQLLIRAGRARRVVVVGSEPDDPVARSIYDGAGRASRLRSAAACVILQADSTGAAARLARSENGQSEQDEPAAAMIGPGGLDPVVSWGDCYGAQGVLQVALAAELVTATGAPVRVRCGSATDGWRSALVLPAPSVRGASS